MNRKITIIVLILLYGHILLSQNNSIGYWIGTMNRDGSIMNVSFEFKQQNNLTNGYFNSPSQKASGVPLDNVVAFNDSIKFQLMSEPVTLFKCMVSNDAISGSFFQDGFSTGTISLKKTQLPIVNFSAIDTSFKSGDIKIACRIYLPNGKGKYPAVIFLHGSGAEGMYANQFFAEYLASKGIVTLIQDKRGVGNSTGNWQTSGFTDLANDHLSALQFIGTFEKVNQKQIGIYGHSQGGTIAPVVASKSKDVAFVIAAAGVGDTLYKQDLYRTENDLKSNGFTTSEVREAMEYFQSWLDIARNGIGLEKIDTLYQQAKNKKWFDWVEIPPREHWLWKFYYNIGNYNSLDYWKKITIPVLLVYGEYDQIEDIGSYIQNIDKVLIDQIYNDDITQIILPKAQHNLCISPGKNQKFFWWHLSPGYKDLIVSWILYRFKN